MVSSPQNCMARQVEACSDRRGPRGLLGVVRQRPAPKTLQLPKKRRKLAHFLPKLQTIVEVEEGEEERTVQAAPLPMGAVAQLQAHVLPSGLPQLLTEPLRIASSPSLAQYVVQRLNACPIERVILLSYLSPSFPLLACSDVGSHVVQVACKVAVGAERTMISSKLRGFAVDLCFSPSGCQVLTTFIETMPVSTIGFVPSELAGRAGEVARSRFGYRVLEATIMHCTEAQMADLEKELVLETVELSKHTHANCVIKHLLEYGTQSSKSDIIQHLLPEIQLLAMDRNASRVVEKALNHATANEQCLIAGALLQARKTVSLVDVACSRCGSATLEVLATSKVITAEFRLQLAKHSLRLAQSKFGRRVIDHYALPLPICGMETANLPSTVSVA